MNLIESTGRTVEEAVQNGIEELGIKRDNAVIKVLCEPSQGFLGLIGGKTARVQVSIRYDQSTYLQHFLEKVLRMMGLHGRVTIKEEHEQIEATISGSQSGLLIGRRGRTLNEMQYLLNTISRRQFGEASKRVFLDVGNYRYRRERTLFRLAERTARKVAATGHEIALESMNPQERRIIHLALQGHEAVLTLSRGDDPYRRVVITPR